MKTDLVTSISAAVLGVIISFIMVNMLVPEIEPVSFKRIDNASMTYELTEPDEEVFNIRALNPTVEVYVGDCTEYDIYGNCINRSGDEEENKEENENDDNGEEGLEPDQENQNGSTN